MAKKFFYEQHPPYILVSTKNLDQRNLSEINNEERFDSLYIFKSVVDVGTFRELVKTDLVRGGDFTLGDAMDYCNALNRKFGYSAVYNKQEKFIDEEGKITTDVSQIHGFRLLWNKEWDSLFIDKHAILLRKEKEKSDKYIVRFVEVSKEKNTEQLQFDGLTTEDRIEYNTGDIEWCFDQKGHSIKSIDASDIEHAAINGLSKRLGYGWRIKSTRNISYVRDSTYKFRLVFVP